MESTFSQPPAVTPDSEKNTDKQPETVVTVASLVSSSATNRQEQERISKDIEQMMATESKTASWQLPLLTLDGLLKADSGAKKPATGSGAESNDAASAKPSKLGEKNELLAHTGDAAREFDEQNFKQNSFYDEPEAVKKYYEKHKKAPADKDRPPADGPENKPDTDDRRPDPKPDVNLKPHYKTNELEQAVKLAKENNLPLVVHVGASWCGPCRTMERNAWPEIEKDAQINQKAVYVHLDVDQAKELPGQAGTLSKQIQDGVKGYPTVKVMNVSGDNGTLSLSSVNSKTGGMSANQLKEFIGKSVK
jgi:thiol-disulfide isomerase/thioredoxin